MKEYRTMRTVRLSAVLACALMTGLAGAQTAPAPATAASAPAGPAIRAELRAVLLDAQNLMNEKKYGPARDKIQAANAFADKSPYESFITARLGLAVAIAEDDAANASKLLEQILKWNASGSWQGRTFFRSSG